MSEPAEAINRFRAAAPAGAAALAVLAAVIGGTVLTRRTADPPAISALESPLASSASPSVAASQPAAAQSSVAAPAPQVNPDPPKGPALPGVAFDQTGASAGRPALNAEIVVKFKDDRKVKDIVDTFWKDAPAARRKFETFKAGRPEFAGVTLDRVTYSNELVLAPVAAIAPEKSAATLRDLASKMGKAADISYAEANVTAKPGIR